MKDLVKKTICTTCKAEVPEDSEFCPYCGNKKIKSFYYDKNNNPCKKCVNCESIIPDNAIYCQYCGKKADEKHVDERANLDLSSSNYQPAKQKSYFIPFILVTLLCFLLGISWYYSSSAIKEQENDNRIVQMMKYLEKTETYSDFNSNRTVLYKPTSEKVLIYANFGNPAILTCEASSEDVNCYWDDIGDEYTIGLNITYTKTGVEYIKITNNLNSKMFYILLIG